MLPSGTNSPASTPASSAFHAGLPLQGFPCVGQTLGNAPRLVPIVVARGMHQQHLQVRRPPSDTRAFRPIASSCCHRPASEQPLLQSNACVRSLFRLSLFVGTAIFSSTIASPACWRRSEHQKSSASAFSRKKGQTTSVPMSFAPHPELPSRGPWRPVQPGPAVANGLPLLRGETRAGQMAEVVKGFAERSKSPLAAAGTSLTRPAGKDPRSPARHRGQLGKRLPFGVAR